MPTPPDVDDLDKINFITAYFWQGCAPPFWLFVEFAKEPAQDLLCILFLFDWQDILKDWLRPGTPRRRTPRRHGRKKRRRLPDLDPNEYVGSKARRSVGEFPGLDLPGARAVFYVSDVADRVAISAAVLEGVTDIGYEGLLGILSFDPNNCPGFAYVTASDPNSQDIVGVAPQTLPLTFEQIDNKQNFEGPSPVAVTTFVGDFTLAAHATITALSAGGAGAVGLTIRDENENIVAEGSTADLIQGESIDLTVSADCTAGEFYHVCRTCSHGSLRFTHKGLLGFSGGLL